MYALIEAACPGYSEPNARREGKLVGPCKLVSSHRTLAAAQKAWRKTDNLNHQFRGILTPDGLRNYHGLPLPHSDSIGAVELRMGIF